MRSRNDKAMREALGDFLGILEYKARHGVMNIGDVKAILEAIKTAGGIKATVKEIAGYYNSVVSPIAKEVDDIKCRMPQTVPVTWPNLAAVNTTPYVSGGFYQGGYGNGGFYGPGWGFGGFGGFGGFNGITF